MNTDKVMGALYGALIGDALGVTYEFMPPGEVADKVNGNPLEIVGGGPFKFPKGKGSDDTDMLLCALRAYSPRGHKFLKDDMVRNMIDWLKTSPPDVGVTTRDSILKWSCGMSPPTNERAQGNGGIMRAMAHSLMAPNVIQSGNFAYDDTRLTHNSHTAGVYSSMYATILRRVIDGRTPDAVLLNVADKGYDELTPDMGGHCVHAYRLALWAYLRTGSFEDGLTQVILSGGDTDTNGIVAGALLGADYGFEQLPKRWVDALDPATTEEARRIVASRWATP